LARTSKALAVVALIAFIALGIWRWSSHSGSTPERPAELAISRGGELVASLRSDPAIYNRYVPGGANAATELLSLLAHSRLVRINRATDELEPMLAEGWTVSDDGLTYTLKLRPGIRFSDG
jgi:ABC-type transport system substrate-binding protein